MFGKKKPEEKEINWMNMADNKLAAMDERLDMMQKRNIDHFTFIEEKLDSIEALIFELKDEIGKPNMIQEIAKETGQKPEMITKILESARKKTKPEKKELPKKEEKIDLKKTPHKIVDGKVVLMEKIETEKFLG